MSNDEFKAFMRMQLEDETGDGPMVGLDPGGVIVHTAYANCQKTFPWKSLIDWDLYMFFNGFSDGPEGLIKVADALEKHAKYIRNALSQKITPVPPRDHELMIARVFD